MIALAQLQKEIDTLPPKYYGKVIDFVGRLRLNEAQDDDLTSAYMAMAADTEREKEAQEWCNAYFGPK